MNESTREWCAQFVCRRRRELSLVVHRCAQATEQPVERKHEWRNLVGHIMAIEWIRLVRRTLFDPGGGGCKWLQPFAYSPAHQERQKRQAQEKRQHVLDQEVANDFSSAVVAFRRTDKAARIADFRVYAPAPPFDIGVSKA